MWSKQLSQNNSRLTYSRVAWGERVNLVIVVTSVVLPCSRRLRSNSNMVTMAMQCPRLVIHREVITGSPSRTV